MDEIHRELKNRVFVATGLGLTTHAIDRFSSRFPRLDILKEVASAKSNPKPMTKRRMNILKKNCPAHHGQHKITDYLINRANIVFVIVDKKIVTTFELGTK